MVKHLKNHDHEIQGVRLGSYSGRPKEEGGHKPLKISVNKFVRGALEKVPNKSKFLEEVARPVLEKMDPGDASVFLWKIDDFIGRGIIRATEERDFKQVSALSWLANCLEDARRLCGVPPPNWSRKETEYLEKPNHTFASKTEYKIALKHSKDLLFSTKEKQRYDVWSPHLVLDSLVFQDLDDMGIFGMDDRCVLQHLKNGYFKEVYILMQRYRQLMDETGLSKTTGFPKLRISRVPYPKEGPFPSVLPNKPLPPTNENLPSLTDYLSSKEINPEVAKRYGIPSQASKQKIKEIIGLVDLLLGRIYGIMYAVSQGTPLQGHCDFCPHQKITVKDK